MRKIIRILWGIIVIQCYLVFALEEINQQEKGDAMTVQVTTLSPPEGNTTFLSGTNWCVARPGVAQADLQNALDWACGLGKADCGPIRHLGSCFQPNTLLAHASFAFNSYYQMNGNSDIACNFGGTAMLTNKNPSYGKCTYATSGSVVQSSAAAFSKYTQRFRGFKFSGVVVLLLYLGS